MIYHTIYKTTNLINGKFYIGKHSTRDPNDSYLGSGKNITKAIKKYGRTSFKKEVLFIFEDPDLAYLKEEEIVDSGMLNDPMCYNLSVGGMGGNLLQRKNKTYKEIYGDRAEDIASKISESKIGSKNPMFGKTHTKEVKQKLSNSTSLKKITAEQRKSAMITRKNRVDSGEIVYGMMGKTQTEESKKKTSQSLTGKRWWHDGKGTKTRSYECPGDDWILGSGPKK